MWRLPSEFPFHPLCSCTAGEELGEADLEELGEQYHSSCLSMAGEDHALHELPREDEEAHNTISSHRKQHLRHFSAFAPSATSIPGQPKLPAIKSQRSPAAKSCPKKSTNKRRYQIAINLSNCKYEVVRRVQRDLKWREVGDDEEWHIYWTDTSVSMDRVMQLNRNKFQKINHFAGTRLSIRVYSHLFGALVC